MKYIAIVALFASQAEAIQYRPTNAQAPWYKEQSTGETWMDPKWPVNYAVPSFGVDHDIKDSLKHSESMGEFRKIDDDGEWVVPDAFKFREFKMLS